ncbi:hypothetical protein, partial [Serratia fonticola]|uniref:hypothetical protein n=1 Tax=Serratia fonticola TaxID=47917 RepID=UPI0021B78F4F
FELLLCHEIPLQGQGCGDLILIAAKSSIYSTKPDRTISLLTTENFTYSRTIFSGDYCVTLLLS